PSRRARAGVARTGSATRGRRRARHSAQHGVLARAQRARGAASVSPEPWGNQMTEPDVVERQLALAWRALTPSAELRERVRARLGPAGGGALAPLPAQSPPARSRWQALRASG